jgi:hypothetical protein
MLLHESASCYPEQAFRGGSERGDTRHGEQVKLSTQGQHIVRCYVRVDYDSLKGYDFSHCSCISGCNVNHTGRLPVAYRNID